MEGCLNDDDRFSWYYICISKNSSNVFIGLVQGAVYRFRGLMVKGFLI